ncbi:hypothetical protein BDW59DRAFT_181731 [Aspergillus cavernicola]|uniref:Major facilitator superfamily (MFS) profile domain-containing protein n=1 Tax=Aspergillus cavernicola TaxID=176166 RepID=A0ABR4HU72_9EURO
MGGVNSSPYYVTEVGIGESDGTVTDTTHQGGIVSIYYLGCIFGCFAGSWLADRIGWINGLFIGSIFAVVGGALQAAIQSSDFMLVARAVTGIGTGALTGITPVLVSETSWAEHRGGVLGYVFHCQLPRNHLGISVAYWLSFGLAFINNGYSDIRWRFLLAFQCIPATLLVLFIKMLLDSPRYYASVGRNEDARELLTRIRSHKATPAEIDREYMEILAMAQDSQPSSPIQFVKILLGQGGRPGANLGRRAWLCVWLQIMASWTGNTVVTAYSPVLLRQAGYSDLTQNGLTGGANIVDRTGRRLCLMLGALSLCTVEIVAGSVYETSLHNPDHAAQYAPAAVAILFLFDLGYASTWGTVAFLIPTEILPSDLRAQGNGFGITGWATGVGMTTRYFLLVGLNLLWIPTSINTLFSTPCPFHWEMKRAYRLYSDGLAERGIVKVGDGSNKMPLGREQSIQLYQEDRDR